MLPRLDHSNDARLSISRSFRLLKGRNGSKTIERLATSCNERLRIVATRPRSLFASFQGSVSATPFTSAMTYEILLIVVIGGIGSLSGSVIASFLYIACSEWWLRFLDSGHIGSMSVPFFRDGFRKVVFSVIIMVIVLFFSRGIMGDKELPDVMRNLGKKISQKKLKAKEGATDENGTEA